MRMWLLLAALVPALIYLAMLDGASWGRDWRNASREPVGLAPSPAETPEAVVQLYAARAVRWRGIFGVHTWVGTKPGHASEYTVYEVSGWRLRRTGTAVNVSHRPPDGSWFGAPPRLLAELRGPAAEAAIPKIEAASRSYPYATRYRVWPGPNSNTFTAHVLRSVPELRGDLPATAIGKDYLGAAILARAPSGTGWQLNILGIIGVLAGIEEGVEVNLLGLTFGLDPLDLSLKVPLGGRLGWPFGTLDRHTTQAAADAHAELPRGPASGSDG